MLFEGEYVCSGTNIQIKESIKTCLMLAPATELFLENDTELYYKIMGGSHMIRFRVGTRTYIDILKLDGITAIYSLELVNGSNAYKIKILSTPYLYLFHSSGVSINYQNVSDILYSFFYTTEGNMFVYLNDGRVSPDKKDDFTFTLDKIFFSTKTETEHYTLIPARILDNSANKYIPEYPIGIYGVLPLATNNSFYTFADGTKAYYKNNLIFK